MPEGMTSTTGRALVNKLVFLVTVVVDFGVVAVVVVFIVVVVVVVDFSVVVVVVEGVVAGTVVNILWNLVDVLVVILSSSFSLMLSTKWASRFDKKEIILSDKVRHSPRKRVRSSVQKHRP